MSLGETAAQVYFDGFILNSIVPSGLTDIKVQLSTDDGETWVDGIVLSTSNNNNVIEHGDTTITVYQLDDNTTYRVKLSGLNADTPVESNVVEVTTAINPY
ncbi:MAG: hypothetical protein AB2374_06720 [Cytobacillus gottheilii]|uniref:hypothetical protein n=1 Tax=Cytobacillus gottheilii TaxID=859144 RepID=UPI00082DC45D|nr:hypothetical protein [Cytobacillus gottheilii]